MNAGGRQERGRQVEGRKGKESSMSSLMETCWLETSMTWLILIHGKCVVLQGFASSLTSVKLHFRGTTSGLFRPDPPPKHCLPSLALAHNDPHFCLWLEYNAWCRMRWEGEKHGEEGWIGRNGSDKETKGENKCSVWAAGSLNSDTLICPGMVWWMNIINLSPS